MFSPRCRSLSAYLCACLLGLAALAGLWQQLGQAVELQGEPITKQTPPHRLQCASYTPFGKDQSPFDQPLTIHAEQIDADLALLAQHFQCIRSYSAGGLQALPKLAAKHGLHLLAGAWVSRDPLANAREIQAVIDMANAYPDTVEAVIVGNETLLRKEVTERQLVSLIEQVKAQVKQPVTYADVWEFWLKYPQLAPAVDFLTIHLLPYWEDQPTGIDGALNKVAQVRQLFAERFAGKDILIGETGWPSAGRQRQEAVPSLINQARFVRGFIHMAEQQGWRYNLIEAFDQPWKRISEGTVGGYWGLFDAERQDKGIMAGTLSNHPQWPNWLGAALLIAALALWLGSRPERVPEALLQPLLAAVAGACLSLWIEMTLSTSRDLGQWLWAGALLLLNALLLSQAMLALGAAIGWRAKALDWLDNHSHWWLAACAFAAAVMMLGLVIEPRYRDFPSYALLLPALLSLWRPAPVMRRETLLLTALIALGIPLQLYQEGLANQQAWGWALTCTLLVAGLWRCLQLRTRPHQAQ